MTLGKSLAYRAAWPHMVCPRAGYWVSSGTTATKSRRGYERPSSLFPTALQVLTCPRQLDICDLSHTFGISVLCLTSSSPPVLNAVIGLTASLAAQARDLQDRRDEGNSPHGSPHSLAVQQPPDVDPTTGLLCGVFSVTQGILTHELGTPSGHAMDDLANLFTVSPAHLPPHPLSTALYYLALRLGK